MGGCNATDTVLINVQLLRDLFKEVRKYCAGGRPCFYLTVKKIRLCPLSRCVAGQLSIGSVATGFNGEGDKVDPADVHCELKQEEK